MGGGDKSKVLLNRPPPPPEGTTFFFGLKKEELTDTPFAPVESPSVLEPSHIPLGCEDTVAHRWLLYKVGGGKNFRAKILSIDIALYRGLPWGRVDWTHVLWHNVPGAKVSGMPKCTRLVQPPPPDQSLPQNTAPHRNHSTNPRHCVDPPEPHTPPSPSTFPPALLNLSFLGAWRTWLGSKAAMHPKLRNFRFSKK